MTTMTLNQPVTALRTGRTTSANWMVQTGQIFKRWATNTLRQPWGIGVSLIQPIIWILLFGQVFAAVGKIPGFGDTGYLTFLAPGILMMTVLYSGAWAGTGWIDDMNSGVMDRMLTSPLRRSAMVTGQLGQQLVICFIQGLGVLAIGALGGAAYDGGIAGMAVALGVSLLLATIFCQFSTAVAVTTGSQVALIGIAQAVVMPVTFLSSTMMSPHLMPSWAATVSTYNPMTWAVECARTVLAGDFDWGFIGIRVAGLLVLAALFFAWSLRAFGTYRKRL